MHFVFLLFACIRLGFRLDIERGNVTGGLEEIDSAFGVGGEASEMLGDGGRIGSGGSKGRIENVDNIGLLDAIVGIGERRQLISDSGLSDRTEFGQASLFSDNGDLIGRQGFAHGKCIFAVGIIFLFDLVN